MSAHVHGLSFESTCVGSAADLFSGESFNMKQRQQTMLSFLSTAEKSRRQTGKTTIDRTILRGWIDHSIRSCSGIGMVNVKTVFLVKCYSLWSWLHQMYFQGKAVRSLNNKSLQQRKCWEFQTNETRPLQDFVVIILHACKRKDTVTEAASKQLQTFASSRFFWMSTNIL